MRHAKISKAAELDADGGNKGDEQAAHNRSADKADGQLHGGKRRHQEVDIGGIELRLHEAGTCVLKRILQDRHDNQARCEKLDITQPLEITRQPTALAEGQLENRHEKKCRNDRRKHGLHPHFQEAADLALEQGPESQPVHFAILADKAMGGGLVSSCIGHAQYLGVFA